jgi:hypothetical protein
MIWVQIYIPLYNTRHMTAWYSLQILRWYVHPHVRPRSTQSQSKACISELTKRAVKSMRPVTDDSSIILAMLRLNQCSMRKKETCKWDGWLWMVMTKMFGLLHTVCQDWLSNVDEPSSILLIKQAILYWHWEWVPNVSVHETATDSRMPYLRLWWTMRIYSPISFSVTSSSGSAADC